MADLSRKIDIFANVAILLVSITFFGVVYHKYFYVQTGLSAPVGKQLAPRGVDWGNGSYSIALVLQKDCRFCTESAPFYRQLTESLKVTSSKAQLLVAMPGKREANQEYLNKLDIHANSVFTVSLDDMKVPGTPALLIVNKEGIVSHGWVGKLSQSEEMRVLQVINELYATSSIN